MRFRCQRRRLLEGAIERTRRRASVGSTAVEAPPSAGEARAARNRGRSSGKGNAAPRKRTAAAQDSATGPLSEVFEEFRAEFGEIGADDEDLETHYNLGIAYREMGLLEEAISEFQKVAKNSQNGRNVSLRHAVLHAAGAGLHGKGPALHRRHVVRARVAKRPDLTRNPSWLCGMIWE